MPTRLFLLLVAAAIAAPSAGALDWVDRVQELRLAPLQTEVEVAFRFSNRGSKAVSITDLRTNCDCLEARADKSSYAPGESGTIKALFTVGDRLGLYERALTVVSSDDPTPVRLAVRIDVPSPAEIEPRTLEWARDAAPEARHALLQVAPGLHLEFTDAVSTSDEFAVELSAVEPGRRYRLQVTPRSTAKPTSAAIRLRARAGTGGQPVVVSTYVYVR